MAERSPAPRRAAGADLVIPALALAFAVYFFVSIADLAWEAKANGVLIGTVLVVLIGVQLVRTGMDLAGSRADLSFDPVVAPREALPKRIGLVVLTVAFIAGMQWLGLTLALFLAMAVALRLMGLRRPGRILGVALAVAACAYLLFVALLESDIPHGPVEKGIAAIVPRSAR